MKHYYKTIFGILLTFFTLQTVAVASPIDMLQSTSDQMLSELNANKATLKSNQQVVLSIVHRILLPHVDMNYMSKMVIGRSAWNSASPGEQQAFTTQYTELLIRTYAAAIASYTDQTVKFYPIRGGWQGLSQVQVSSDIIQPDGPPIPVTYQLLLEGQQWKVIDMSVDNVSIVENYRAQFANDLNQGGLDSLTTKLQQHNEKLAQQ